ncbi:uncharacterized protein MONOS_9918 [Monocercomonoides exilis]|uniref:uncharacterized protein n=1 Tax=Monocercomonoides exilis TaxID=2049356 RepID=UPI00355AAB57|nr:hypothetical protein MONOS_9918 [Monocercomonoides exilis]|eukprot:MONOS_9918.1-p1 / transcript=MONOS_9918.1 / gene=MONOS_9918 / organism=Monocercomonoides_exilis_PA203 / gene_product=unspecified product / transcript_product=unspecified product / location=Mono_scaffold00427:16518-17192(-) / protein_length=186 / sequence_SO=supercontig / SO=protein_coding / is_pseudo=false
MIIVLLSLLFNDVLSQCFRCMPCSQLNMPLSNGYSTMSVTDPETGKVYKQIDDGSGNPQWIEENNMCTQRYIDGLGYVSCPSADWKPGCGPTILKEPPKGIQKQIDQMNKMGMFPGMKKQECNEPNQCSQPAPPPPQPQQTQQPVQPAQPQQSCEQASPRRVASRSPRAARNMDRDAIRRGNIQW